MRPAALTLPILLTTLFLLVPARARARPELVLQGTLGAAWRTSIDSNDRNPGFLALLGNADLSVALSWGGIALVGGARGGIGAAFGSASGTRFTELTGSLGFELALGERILARIGGDAGEILFGDLHAPIVGGYFALGFHAARFADKKAAAIFTLRIDVDDVLTADDRLPHIATSLAAGVGLRY